MKHRRKTRRCLNCQLPLDEIYNYCPQCGQENTRLNVSLGMLLGDFFSTYFALDSKITRSIKPFFLKPGYLTNRFNEGKRVSYANPLRLYLVLSLFYFFIVTLVAIDIARKDGDQTGSRVSFNLENIPEDQKGRVDSITKEMNAVHARPDSAGNISSTRTVPPNNGTQVLTIDSRLPKLDLKKFIKLKNNLNLSDRQVLDSLNLGELNTFQRHVMLQAIRISRSNTTDLFAFLAKNLPVMMLVLIPIFAMILQLVYWKNITNYYIQHLIHALHLHTFAYLIYGILLLLIFFTSAPEVLQWILGLAGFIGVSTYAFLSFMRVYNDGWRKTLLKFNLTGVIYLFLILFFFLGELIISLLLF